MSHSYGNGNPNENNYLSRKRLEEDIPNESRYRYDKYDKYDKYGNHSRYNNMNYIHSKPPQGNNYYNTNSRYRGNYYNNPRPFHSNGYSNKIQQNRDYKRPYQKYTNPIENEGIRNLSHCEMPSPPHSSLTSKPDGDSLKSISSSTGDSKSSLNGYNNVIKEKDINKLGYNNISPYISSGRGQNFFQNNQHQYMKLTSPSRSSSSTNIKYKEKQIITGRKEDNYRRKKDEDDDDEENKDEEIPIFIFPKLSESFNYEPFNGNSIDIEENPLDNFDLYPKNLYEVNSIPKKINNLSVSDSMFNNNVIKDNEKTLTIKSCYLLAKIPNWRLVTNFVPVSSLTEEKFKNINSMEEVKEDDDLTEELDSEKNNTDSKDEKKNKKTENKSYLIYYPKYEDAVEKYLEKSLPMKRQVKKDIFNKEYIIAQYHYDILKYKNKIKQNKYKINYLNIKQENSKIDLGLDDKIKE